MSLTYQVPLRLSWCGQGKYEACGWEKVPCEPLTITSSLTLSPFFSESTMPVHGHSQV